MLFHPDCGHGLAHAEFFFQVPGGCGVPLWLAHASNVGCLYWYVLDVARRNCRQCQRAISRLQTQGSSEELRQGKPTAALRQFLFGSRRLSRFALLALVGFHGAFLIHLCCAGLGDHAARFARADIIVEVSRLGAAL